MCFVLLGVSSVKGGLAEVTWAEKTFCLSQVVAGRRAQGLRVDVGSAARQALTLRACAYVRRSPAVQALTLRIRRSRSGA